MEKATPKYPKIRPLETLPARVEGKNGIVLRDALGIAQESLFLPLELYFFIAHMDGTRDVVDLQAEYMRQFGDLFPSDQIREIITLVSDNYLLDDGRYRERREALEAEYLTGPDRPPSHAGSAYPDDPRELRRFLDDVLTSDPAAEEGSEPDGLVIPHIDVRIGAPAYSQAFGLLQEPEDRTFLILGVGHFSDSDSYQLCPLDLRTPLGKTPIDRGVTERIEAASPFDLRSDPLAHRGEHSIEFPILFLQHLADKAAAFEVVPILCPSFHKALVDLQDPRADPSVSDFLEHLREIVLEEGLFPVASVDFAHVGRRFGDAGGIDRSRLADVEIADRALLNKIVTIDPAGFFQEIAVDGNLRHVDATGAVYTLLSIAPWTEGALLAYHQNFEQETNSAVSFASLALWQEDGGNGTRGASSTKL